MVMTTNKTRLLYKYYSLCRHFQVKNAEHPTCMIALKKQVFPRFIMPFTGTDVLFREVLFLTFSLLCSRRQMTFNEHPGNKNVFFKILKDILLQYENKLHQEKL